MSLFDLSGKTAVVTGADKGIGKAMAVALAEAGANIIGTSRSGDFSAVQQEVEQTGKSYNHYSVDFLERNQIYAFTRQLFNDVPRVDILVNNAGTILRKPAAEHPDEFWDQVIQVNLTAQFILGRECSKHMIAHGSGKMIFICSLLSFQGGITVPGYTARKSGLAGLVRAFANEWAGKGIGVNGIAPGYIATDNTRALQEDPERNASILQRIPAARWGTPNDLKGPVQFLAGRGSDYVNGTILFVDGGWMSR
jgi:2-deoxy-D-gluconate 3-dehydrogenase